MTAKEAIKVVRSRRKGAIQNKSQEEVLHKLDKEIRESRMIFHSSPRFKLEDFLFHQKKLLPLSYESETRFIPNLVLICLERLETLISSGICSPLDIALAFYNPNDSTCHKGEWTNYHEKTLKGMKEKINSGNFEMSEIDDPRFLVQSLLDYFDHFVSPAIHTQFIDTIHDQIHLQGKLTKDVRDQLFKRLDKKEFLLVECFVRFFSKLVINVEDEMMVAHFRKAILRLCLSLVLERKKWDKLFLKRSLIQEHIADDRVTYLNVFMLKWIENFSNNFTESYMVSKSPLQITEKLVEEKIQLGLRKRGTYLERVLTKGKVQSERGTPAYLESDEIKMAPSNFHTPVRQQINQEDQSQESPKQDSYRVFLSPIHRNENKYSTFSSPRIVDSPEIRVSNPGSPDSQFKVESSSQSEDQAKDSPCEYRSTLNSGRSVYKTVRIGDDGDEKLPSSCFSPSKAKARAVTHARVSLLRGEDTPFFADANAGGSQMHRNYDNLFSKNLLFSEETPRQSFSKVSVESDGASELSEKERFNELLEEIEHLSSKKQSIILEKLLKLKEAASNS